MITDAQRIDRYHQALENARARLARCISMSDPHGIAYNERRIAKLEKMLSEPLKPLPPPLPYG